MTGVGARTKVSVSIGMMTALPLGFSYTVKMVSMRPYEKSGGVSFFEPGGERPADGYFLLWAVKCLTISKNVPEKTIRA